MATGPSENRREALICSLCLEIYQKPKLLPCYHTFCLKCLEDLTSRCSSPTFPCPNCRCDVTIPSGGVAAFQNNFYLHPEDLDKARDGTLCLTHPKQDLDLYCVDCHLPVCLKCVLTEHKQHTTKDLSEAASEASTQLSQDQVRLRKAVSYMTDEVAAEKREQQALQDKKMAMKTVIRNKYATLVAMADKFRDELLADVDKQCEETEKNLVKELNSKQNNLQELSQLQQRIQETVNSGAGCQLLAVANEMREGRGSPQAVGKLTPPKRTFVCRPVGNSTVTDIRKQVQDYFGGVKTVWMERAEPEVTVTEQFRCGDETDIEVFSICNDNGNVWVSFARCGLKEDSPSKKFDEKGKLLQTVKEAAGAVSWKSKNDGNGMYVKFKVSGWSNVNSKSCSDTHLRLCNNLPGTAFIKKDEITSTDPFQIKQTDEFKIKVGGPCHAFDANSNQQLFVVLDEPQTPDTQRKVQLYRRHKEDVIDTYKPPPADFQPSDACFYNLGGQEVLLVLVGHGGGLTVHPPPQDSP